MKKLAVTILGISVLAIGGSATVAGAPTATRPPQVSNPTLSAEVVDDIAVPLDILLYVQTEHQGYAVAHASKVNRGGQPVYRLQVGTNDMANDGTSFYLFYDMSWKLLSEEKIAQPTNKAEIKKIEQPQQPLDKPRNEQEKPNPETSGTQPTQPTTTTGDTTTPETSEPSTNTGTGDDTNSTQTDQTPATTDDDPTDN